MKEIEALLRQTMGLHAPTVGSAAIQHAVRARMAGLNVAKPKDYLELVRTSPGEWKQLVEKVVVTETWFFRDREPFRALAMLARTEWLPAHPSGILKLLSLPCATGEEPYSLAMALLDAGMPETRFQIDGIDISAAAIAGARRGEYGKNSFRGKELGFRARYFKAREKIWLLDERVRNRVRFQTGNVLDDGLAPGRAYDFIFCRNLLIYFDRTTQEKVLHKLAGWLAKDGVLFVGSAEAPIAARHGFAPVKMQMSFACRKGSSRALSPERGIHAASMDEVQKAGEISGTTDGRTLKRHESETTQHELGSTRALACNQPAHPPVVASGLDSLNDEEVLNPSSGRRGANHSTRGRVRSPDNTAVDLTKARKFADEGKLEETRRICEAYLQAGGVSAEAYYLLGLVSDAAGMDSKASEFYRKALYLEPDHYETLQQWALLSEKNGDDAHARILNERAERLQSANSN